MQTGSSLGYASEFFRYLNRISGAGHKQGDRGDTKLQAPETGATARVPRKTADKTAADNKAVDRKRLYSKVQAFLTDRVAGDLLHALPSRMFHFSNYSFPNTGLYSWALRVGRGPCGDGAQTIDPASQSRHPWRKSTSLVLAFACAWVAPALHAERNSEFVPHTEEWHQYGSDNLQLVTDLPIAQAQKLNQALHAFAQVVEEYLPEIAERHDGVVRMLVFKERRALQRLVRKTHFAAFAQPGLNETLLVVAPSGRKQTLYDNALHEYTHYLLRTHSRAYPLWYEEGIASVLGASNVRWRKDHIEVRVGMQPAPQAVLDPGELSSHGLQQTLAARVHNDWGVVQMHSHYQRSAWIAHYFTFNQRQDAAVQKARLQQYWERRDTNLFESMEVSPNRLLRKLRVHASRNHRARMHRVELMQPPQAVAVAPLEVVALQARVAESVNPQKAAELYAYLLRDAPERLDWRADLARAQMQFDPELAARTLEQTADAGAPSILIERASLAMLKCPLDAQMTCRDEWLQAGEWLRLALAKDPDRFDGIFQLGLVELYTGKPGTAINYLRLAHQRVPWSARVNFQLGECYRLLGYSMARKHLVQARDWAHTDLTVALAEAALDLMAASPNGD